jgi:iron complex transport system ATP-binding protein
MSLQLNDLAVDIAGRRIVTDINLAVGDHEFAGLVGPNGSGKSTILKAIYRVHPPSAGGVLLDGRDLLSLRPKDAARRIAVVAQESTSEFDFTVREMVMIGRTPHKGSFERDTATDRAIVDHAIERVGCERLAYRRFNTLSGGEKQLVLVARALAQGADHLILDEPTNHLDIHNQVEILEVVAGLGVTVLAALHDLSLAALFCRVIYVLCAGRLVTGGPPGLVLTPAIIRQAYGADVLVIEHPDTGTPHLIPRRVQPTTRDQLPGDTPAHSVAQPDTPALPKGPQCTTTTALGPRPDQAPGASWRPPPRCWPWPSGWPPARAAPRPPPRRPRRAPRIRLP